MYPAPPTATAITGDGPRFVPILRFATLFLTPVQFLPAGPDGMLLYSFFLLVECLLLPSSLASAMSALRCRFCLLFLSEFEDPAEYPAS